MAQISSIDSKLASQSGSRLMALAVAVSVAIITIIFSAFAFHYDQTARRLRLIEIDNYLSAMGSTTAWGVDKWLAEREHLISGLNAELSNSHGERSITSELREEVYQNAFVWTYFGETNGAYHIWPPDDNLPADYDPRTRPWYLAAIAKGGATFTEPYRDISTNVETITVATPVRKNGALFGVAAADFTTEQLSEILAETDLGGLGFVFLVSPQGVVLSHPKHEFAGRSLSDLFDGPALDVEGGMQRTSIDGKNKFISFSKASDNSTIDWRLGFVVDQDKAFESLAEFRRTAAIAAIFAIFVTVGVLGFVIHRVLVRPLLSARRAADAANAAKSDFLASMSHEIRTPMNGILGIADVLINTGLNPRQKELTSIIVSSGGALMTVINDILDFSKMEAGKLSLLPRPFNFRQTVYDLATLMQARAIEKDLELVVRYAPNMPEGIVADEARLRQIIGNLVGNAVKFTEHGYIMIDVTGERNGEMAEITVSVTDTGIGIENSDLSRVFEKFEQADGSNTRKFGGTGLGLAISKNLVEMMDGSIGAESDIGKGSRFWFKIQVPVDTKIKAMPSVSASTFDGARILAVDDNAVNRRVIAELASGWGLDATIVANAETALAALEESVESGRRYKAILMDFQMPGEDGVSLTRRIQTDKRFDSIPVVLLSSVDSAQIDPARSGAKIVTSLAKPVRPSQLMDVLARIMVDESSRSVAKVAEAMRQTEEPVETVSDGRPVLLIAEDNVVNQLVVTNMICENDYRVVIAENGRVAVEKFLESRPAAILMDLSMPEMDGLEATIQIRKLEAERGLQPTPIIAATAHVLEEDRDKCRLAGMNDFIPKPIRKSQLDQTLDKWIDEAIAWDESAAG
ncbi:MAG: response regulator [Parvularculaceae bacterium]|nr:response regulator [Parvularculaceae bacterium]